MGIQDKITAALAPSLRKIFDYKVLSSGTETQVVRLKVQKNEYQDIIAYDVVSHDLVTIHCSALNEIPITRLRTDLTSPIQNVQTNLYMYDILPMEAIAKFADNIEWYDILIRKLHSDQPTAPQLYLVLQVTEVLGSFSNNFLLWRKFNVAPYNEPLPSEIQNIVDSYTLDDTLL